MKLYYAPGACSLAPHIAASEAGVPVELVKVDFASKTLPDGTEYAKVNPRGYVPALKLADGDVLTEANVLVQYIVRRPEPGLRAHAESRHGRALEGRTVAGVHRNRTPQAVRPAVRQVDAGSHPGHAEEEALHPFRRTEKRLTDNDYLMGNTFSGPDAYAFTVISWTKHIGFDMSAYPKIQAYLARVAARPKVKAAMVEEKA